MRFAVKSSDKCGGSRAEGNFRMKVIFFITKFNIFEINPIR
ncbi:hypothetical protein AC02_3813 [Escherichia coli 3-020-07_S3_C1]|nr:hypothetical protein HMPREF1602_05073 [Escherichia coli 907889]EYD78639.1 hypothetical protein AB11_4736 [Escherichia coli 1-176-05_S1_C1]KDU61819.1 hypothetical protein AB21_2944 [Escherichia coli 4-203-08_S1_C1]KDZ36729.1 hypothetical protein AC02_3813 [Escherichia coli 3-020-07_S3_C1]KEK93730.1 hypothetical protein AB49_2795 [Escherichia coli 4-203-08_S1_C2]KEK99677.1 hypothetical protein AB78_2302 [Escherichia coli 4-203-08_S1_C3]